MSRAELATEVNAWLHARMILDADIDCGYVAKLEAGKHRWPREEGRRAAFRAVLGVSSDREIGFSKTRRSRRDEGDHARSAVGDGQPSDAVRQVGHGLPDGQPQQLTETHWLRLLDALTVTAVTHGSAGLYPIAFAQVRLLEADQQSGRSPVGLAVADARWSEFMSWLCDNDGATEGSSWLTRAYARALETGSPQLTSYVLMRKSQRALDHHDVHAAVELARRALDAQLPSRTRALCLTRMAEALAAAGDSDSLQVVAAAQRHAGSAVEDPDDAVAQHCDVHYVQAAQARCRRLLGQARTAATMLEDVIREAPTAPPLDHGMWLAQLADCYRHTDPERAAHTATTALHLPGARESARVWRALLPVAVDLRGHATLPAVGRFLTAHRRTMPAPVAG
ncbi:MAG TPA: hypothetical protein VNV66_13305 [Pilimelia sp.]|nr:hypothetical protein [Pilimelia sp.]